ncbi:MAG TPA: twin-arginine translocase subunit TatC [Steroidobacteraceae bacterium]|nr:twin-arginine translocase subunit TatC [Steroidobacteraceae bacterium]
MSQDPSEPEQLAEGTLISHLLELRQRLLRAVVAVLVVFLPLAFFANDLFTVVAQPLVEKLPEGTSIIATSVIAPFMTPLKLALIMSVFIAMPFILYQAWAFIAPGLYRNEKRFAMPLFASSVVLFYVGVAFAYFIVFPLMFGFLTSSAPEGVLVMTDMSSYLDFTMLLFFAFGMAFEVPVATVLLVATGLVKIEALKKHRGYIVLGIFVFAAFLTPPDAVSQSFMAVPMYLLYEIGILLAQFLTRDRVAAGAHEETTE